MAYDEQRTENAGRKLTKQLCAVIRDALEPSAPGQIGRYDDEFEVRAFGDNITLWGTPVVLIETGPWPSPDPDAALVRLNFVAIVSALDALATGAVERADPQRYETLPMNESKMFAVLVRNATVISGKGIPPFTADIGRRRQPARADRSTGERELQTSLDNRRPRRSCGRWAALRTIDATGMTACRSPTTRWRPGRRWICRSGRQRPRRRLRVGQPARIAILKPAAEPGKFVVESVLR